MTDLEITRLCAEAMGMEVPIPVWQENGYLRCTFPGGRMNFNPLHDDAQAMALVKKFNLTVMQSFSSGWAVTLADEELGDGLIRKRNPIFNPDLNRAICECVAKMRKEKTK